ncbi:ABC transporter ATP-binding protein [Aminivibrio sp.]|uniref:ABC transporter ATP-binding protein n=1 Tax=Aminivibrio sp. TaxID=1872489 RepID=UPI001A50C151|nr:ABC transporter ATP-binding protein [Aminivibrio sp.]MBL3540437.1 ABC transporter ATP-binding protein [Aminivibrio sp.]
MAHITLDGISKSFGKIQALKNIDLEVRDREFFVLFGPSGAGKTTVLKTVAGIEFPDGGLLRFDDEIMNLVEPALRNVSMVFENYALYPHMTVYDNIASPMRSPLHRKDEQFIKQSVQKVADMLGIGHLLERLPSQLSNGQRQRTAIGRCLVRSPRVFLMDEPLAHLDAKLRHLMRTELKAMQTEFDTTTIYVTHDYTEAMSLSDRVGIIDKGEIVQIGSSDEIYYTPVNEFVAKLVGEPEINMVDIDLVRRGDLLYAVSCDSGHFFPVEEDVARVLENAPYDGVGRWRMGIRGINVGYSFEKSDDCVEGTVYNLEPIGNKSILTIKVKDLFFQAVAQNDLQAELDSRIFMTLDMQNALFFNGETGAFVTRHNQAELVGRH